MTRKSGDSISPISHCPVFTVSIFRCSRISRSTFVHGRARATIYVLLVCAYKHVVALCIYMCVCVYVCRVCTGIGDFGAQRLLYIYVSVCILPSQASNGTNCTCLPCVDFEANYFLNKRLFWIVFL